MDVLYANLATFQIAEDLDLTPNSILRGCDEQTVRSINGCRVTDTILRSVPDVPTFRLALKVRLEVLGKADGVGEGLRLVATGTYGVGCNHCELPLLLRMPRTRLNCMTCPG
jgi:hypothetical protein